MEDLHETLNTNEKLDLEQRANGMGVALDELTSVLEREIECYTDLLETARSEQKAIIYGKLKELKLAIEAEENLIASTRALDEVRQNIVAMIAKQIGCDGPGLTLKEIIQKAAPEQTGKLNSLRDELRKLTRELGFVNRGNAQLIKSSIDFINETMWILLNADRHNESVYDSAGKEQQKAKRQVLVDKLG